MIVMYDLNDNLLTMFDNYKECSEYFGTSSKSIQCYISRSQKGKIDRKRDKLRNRWVRLYKIEEDKDGC